MARDREVHELLLAARQRLFCKCSAQALRGLKQFRQANVGVVRPADRRIRGLGLIVDATLFGIHLGAVQNLDARHGVFLFRLERLSLNRRTGLPFADRIDWMQQHDDVERQVVADEITRDEFRRDRQSDNHPHWQPPCQQKSADHG